MKKNVRLLLFAISALLTHVSYAQVTLVSDNTNLTTGFVLPNGTPLLQSDSGQIYTTNGTIATLVSADVRVSDSGSAAVFNNQLFFAGINTSNDVELWVTDGTAANTRLIKNISPSASSTPNNFFVFNNKLYFTADDGSNGRELWSSDGTSANTTIASNIDNAPTSSLASDVSFFQNNSTVLFAATSNNILGLYKLTNAGVELVKNNIGDEILVSPGIYAAAIGNRTVFTVKQGNIFTGKAQLWSTDGTAGNTVLLNDFGNGSSASFFPAPVLFQNKLFFASNDLLGTTSSLWTTDGTPANTTVFKTFPNDPNGSLSPTLFNSLIFNERLYFTAYSTASGNEMWSTDGTAANTVVLKDINPGTANSDPFLLIDYGALTNAIANNNFINYTSQQFHTIFNGKFYFSANDGTHGNELWCSDGTAANTKLVKDINTTGDGIGTSPIAFYTTTGIYLPADDGNTGNEPWVTDGTTTGTNLVADINTGSNGSDPTFLFIYNNQLYLNASNGGAASDLYKINQRLTALPVSLLTFTATRQQQSVVLNWTTTNETNVSRFTIERSTDGTGFNEIGSVGANGNSTTNKSYQFTDNQAMQANSTVLYYRLKTTDKDGKYSYSGILMVQLQDGVFTFSVSPNPVRNQLTVSFTTSGTEQTLLRISDANGKPVYQHNYGSSSGSSVQQNINASSFAKGTYFIQIIRGKEVKTLKFIKQ